MSSIDILYERGENFNHCYLLPHYIQIFFELQFKWNITLLQFPIICELFPVLFLTSQHLSPLLVLGFTVERYISVCHPFKRERYCTTRRAVVVISGLVGLALLVNSVQGYFWRYDHGKQACELREEVIAEQPNRFVYTNVHCSWSFLIQMKLYMMQ